MATERRLIDANAFIDDIKMEIAELWLNGLKGTPQPRDQLYDIIDRIGEQPTVDAVEAVHGRWIPLEYDGYADGAPVWDLWECSECREEHRGYEDTLTPYCPNCGAKMDKEEQQ